MLTEQVPVQRATPRKVCITGAVYPSTSFLVSELLQLDQLHTKGGITICLHHKDTNKYGGKTKCEVNIKGVFFSANHLTIPPNHTFLIPLQYCYIQHTYHTIILRTILPYHTPYYSDFSDNRYVIYNLFFWIT